MSSRSFSSGLGRGFFLWVPVLALLAACHKPDDRPADVRPVQVVKIELAPDQHDASYTGAVTARYETTVGFRVPGKIVARMVDVGNAVTKGQMLARLDPQDSRLSAEASRAQLVAARADFAQAKADLARYKDLYARKFIAAAELDRRQALYDTSAARLEQASAQHELSRNQSAYTALSADYDGVVTAVVAEVGEVVTAGRAVFKIARPSEKEVAISVPENRLAELRAADEVRVTLWAQPEKAYRGRIRELSPSADAVTRTYMAKVSVLDPDAAVKLGMTANVYLQGSQRGEVARLPLTALFQKGTEPAVWVVDAQTGQVNLRPVQVGRYTQDYVTILSGLQDGDLVVRAGVHKLIQGEKVRVMPDAAQS